MVGGVAMGWLRGLEMGGYIHFGGWFRKCVDGGGQWRCWHPFSLERNVKRGQRIALADVLLGFKGRSSYESDKEIYKQVCPFEKDI